MTKAKPLSTDNTPNDLDPAIVDKLAELDRTDPIDPNDCHGDHIEPGSPLDQWTDPGPTGLDFEAAMKLEGEQPDLTGVHMISSSGEEQTFRWSQQLDLTSWAKPPGTGTAPLEEHTADPDDVHAAEKAYAKAVREGQIAKLHGYTPTANPYILESNTVLNDLRSAANQARRTIAALDREIADLDRTADEQIALINARRDANKAQREKRKEDLMKIVAADAMVNGQPKGTSE